jgi:hypothetical protein
LLHKDAGIEVSGHLSRKARQTALQRSRERGHDGQSPRF